MANFNTFLKKPLNFKTEKLLGLLVPLLFFFVVLVCSRFWEILQYDYDEGISLMTAFLHSKGYILYKQIWCDQPPFFTLLLSPLIKIFGPSVFNGRILMLVFSSLLLWGVFKIISKTKNYWTALFAVFLLIFTPYYVRLSISVMRGLPAIALAILSSYSVFLYQTDRKKKYLIISAFFLALALQTKLFIITFLPAILGQIIIIEGDNDKQGQSSKRQLSAVLLWSGACTLVYLYIAFIATSLDFSQLLKPYTEVIKRTPIFTGDEYVPDWFQQDYDIALLAVGALIFSSRQERDALFFPLTCFISGAFLTIVHYPVWYSYRPLILLPMCWLASFGFNKFLSKETWRELKSQSKIIKIRGALTIIFLLSVLIASALRIPFKLNRLKDDITIGHRLKSYRKIINLLEQCGNKPGQKTSFIVTDWAILAFYAKLPTPPYLAVVSNKRVTCGLLTPEDFVKIIKKEHPIAVMIFRFPHFLDQITPYLVENYELKNMGPDLYILKSLTNETKIVPDQE